MAAVDERPCDCDCDCGCDDVGSSKDNLPKRVLGSINHSADLYVTTPPKTKWIFVDDVEKVLEDFNTYWTKEASQARQILIVIKAKKSNKRNLDKHSTGE